MAAFLNFSMNGGNHGLAKRDTQLKECNLHVSPPDSHRYMNFPEDIDLSRAFTSQPNVCWVSTELAFVTESTLLRDARRALPEYLYLQYTSHVDSVNFDWLRVLFARWMPKCDLFLVNNDCFIGFGSFFLFISWLAMKTSVKRLPDFERNVSYVFSNRSIQY